MPQKFANRAVSTLQAGINNSVTSLAVAGPAADLYPVADTGTSPVNTGALTWFKAMIIDTSGNYEIVHVRTRTGGSATFSNVIRGQDGTTAQSFSAGALVINYITAADAEASLSHPGVGIAAHAATAISNTPAGTIASTTVQAAINELDTDIGTKLNSSAASSFGLTLIGSADAAAARTTLAVPIDFLNTARIDVASASNINLTSSSPNTRHINITGTTNISSVTIVSGQFYFVRFLENLTLVASANILTPLGLDIQVGTGDTCMFRAVSNNIIEVFGFVKHRVIDYSYLLNSAPLTTGGEFTSYASATQASASRIVGNFSSGGITSQVNNGFLELEARLQIKQNTGTSSDRVEFWSYFNINGSSQAPVYYRSFPFFGSLGTWFDGPIISTTMIEAAPNMTLSARIASPTLLSGGTFEYRCASLKVKRSA